MHIRAACGNATAFSRYTFLVLDLAGFCISDSHNSSHVGGRDGDRPREGAAGGVGLVRPDLADGPAIFDSAHATAGVDRTIFSVEQRDDCDYGKSIRRSCTARHGPLIDTSFSGVHCPPWEPSKFLCFH